MPGLRRAATGLPGSDAHPPDWGRNAHASAHRALATRTGEARPRAKGAALHPFRVSDRSGPADETPQATRVERSAARARSGAPSTGCRRRPETHSSKNEPTL